MVSQIEDDLKKIRNYIVKSLRDSSRYESKKPAGEYLNNVSNFLQRLIESQEKDIIKDESQLRAGRQLLCCIGIDLKNKYVPASHYRKIFESIDTSNYAKQARMLFLDAIKSNDLFYKESSPNPTSEYCVIVFPIKDWKFYIDPKMLGVTGESERHFVQSQLIDKTSIGNQVHLKTGRLKKANTAFGYFWTTTFQDINQILTSVQPTVNKTTQVVDKLGLSHLSFDKEEHQFYFYIHLGNYCFTTFIPNATIVDWDNPGVGFLSNVEAESGRTFPISGFKNVAGLRERVFTFIEIEKESLAGTQIQPLKEKISPISPVNAEEIVIEGVNRFSAIKRTK